MNNAELSKASELLSLIASGLNKTLSVEQLTTFAKEVLVIASGKVSTATWAEAGAAGKAAADKIETPEDAERLFREKP